MSNKHNNKNRHKGRPEGSPNVTDTQLVTKPACLRCGITDRTEYRLVSVCDHKGVRADGSVYTHVINRRCRCLGCGQTRVDKFFENKVPAASPGQANEPV